MPVREAVDDIKKPTSVVRQRPINTKTSETEKNTSAPTIIPLVVQRASRSASAGGESDVQEWKRLTGSLSSRTKTRKQTSASQVVAKKGSARSKTTCLLEKPVLKAHPLFYLGLGMLVMVGLWMALSAMVDWGTNTFNDFRYGRPRTFQTDAWVGHNEQAGSPSHFIVMNLERKIEIIEIAGGDASHTRIYTGPQLYGDGADLVPVTLSFLDVNGDKKPDMIVHFQHTWVVFINDNGGFRQSLPSERSAIEHTLARYDQYAP